MHMAQNEDQLARVEGQGEGTPTGPLTPPPGYGSASPPPPPPSGNTVYVPPELRPSSSTQPVQPVQRPQPAPQMVASAKEPRRTPILGPILLIGVGVIFLLINIGVLSQDIWSQLVQLWP